MLGRRLPLNGLQDLHSDEQGDRDYPFGAEHAIEDHSPGRLGVRLLC